MESSSSVRGDAEKITSSFGEYDSIIDGLSGTWEGLSYNNMKDITSHFSNLMSKYLSKRLENYADACDEYEKLVKNYNEYLHYKEEAAKLKEEKNSFSTQEKVDNHFYYRRVLNEYGTALKKIDDYETKCIGNYNKMKSYLSLAGSGKVFGSEASSTVSYSIAPFSGK